MPKTISITEAGRKDLEKERKELIARRPEIAEKIALALAANKKSLRVAF